MKQSTLLYIACFFVLAASVVGIQMTSPAHAQSKAQKIDFVALLGKDFDAYEKVLGKPKLVYAPDENSAAEVRFYKVAGFTRVILTKGGSTKPYAYVSQIVFHFPKGSIKDWKTALMKAGFPSNNVKVEVTKEYTLLDEKGNKWSGAWIPNNPDVAGLDVLEIYFHTPADALEEKNINKANMDKMNNPQ